MKIKALALISCVSLLCSFGNTVQDPSLSELWKTEAVFMTPECVVYDDIRQSLYVSNFNDKGGFRNATDTLYDEFISRVNLNGSIDQLKWIDNLIGPTGMAIFKDQLFVVERNGVACVDLKTEKIKDRVRIIGALFLNDIVVAPNGDIFISDSAGGKIYRYSNNHMETWIEDGNLLKGVNGLYVEGNQLVAGTRGDKGLLSVAIDSKAVEIIYPNSLTGVDGLYKLNDDYIMSWLSGIRIMKKNGDIHELWEGENKYEWCADFCFLPDKNMLIGPTFSMNQLIAFRLQ